MRSYKNNWFYIFDTRQADKTGAFWQGNGPELLRQGYEIRRGQEGNDTPDRFFLDNDAGRALKDALTACPGFNDGPAPAVKILRRGATQTVAYMIFG